MLLLLHISIKKVILLEEEAVILQLICKRLRIYSLCKQLVLTLHLLKNELLHRVEQPSYIRKEDSVREMKEAEICLHSHCLNVSLMSLIS